MRSDPTRLFVYPAVAMFMGIIFYALFTVLALYTRPLNPDLAYEALVAELKQMQAGHHPLNLSDTTLMQRQNELIFYGRGQVRSADRRRDLPILENYEFQYIGVVRRKGCSDWFPNCYGTDKVEITGTKFAGPMI
jgi:hypothetical protein